MNLQISFRVKARAVVLRMLKSIIMEQLKKTFISVTGFFMENGKAILNVEVEDASAVNEIMDIIINKTTEIFKNSFFTNEIPVYGNDFNVKMVA